MHGKMGACSLLLLPRAAVTLTYLTRTVRRLLGQRRPGQRRLLQSGRRQQLRRRSEAVPQHALLPRRGLRM